MTSTNTTIAKIAALIAGLGLVALSFAVAPAHAQTATTTAQMQAQIAALQAQIAALQAQLGGSASVTIYARDLTIGSRGTDVTALQSWLITKGFSIPAGATGYFSVQTRAAVAAFQAANGITPTAGYFGPITRARINALVSTGTGTGTGTGGTTTGALQGGAGRLTNLDMVGDIFSDLHEGDSVTKVLGFSATAQDSDIAVQRVDVNFTIGGTGSSNLDRYIDSVSLYQDGTKLATLDASSGDKNGRVWTFRFSDLNGVIRQGNTSNFYIEVTPVTSIGSAETGASITAALPSDGIRAIDGEGISETYTPSGSLTQSFTVSTATTGTVTVTAASDNPSNSQVAVSTTNTTTGIDLLNFNLKSKNQSSTVDSLPISFGTSDNNLSDVISTVRLMKGSTVLKSKTVSAGSYGVIVFDNVNLTASQDATTEYSVQADLKSTASYPVGTTVVASTTGSLAGWDVSDVNGNNTTISGSAVGGTVTLTTTGVTVAKGNMTAQTTAGLAGAGDVTQYALPFTVTAGDDDLYIDRSTQRTLSPSAAGGGIAWATTTSSTAGVTGAAATSFSAADTNNGDTATSFKVPAGTTRTFTLNVSLTATGSGFTGVMLTGINYGTVSNTDTSTQYYTANLDTFKTQDVFMTTH
jgi:peptidoglycan hydrolase-like protein with peptidoglycan-binding domain